MKSGSMGREHRKAFYAPARTLLGLLILAAVLYKANMACATSADTSGTFHMDCPISALEFSGFENSVNASTYSFKGDCSQTSETHAMPDYPYTLTGTWNKVSKQAVERIESSYGTYSRTAVCDYDPWLDSTSSCQAGQPTISNNSVQMSVLNSYLTNLNRYPVSGQAIADHRGTILNKILAQSIRISAPSNDNTFSKPAFVTVIVELDNVVSKQVFPGSLLVLLKGEEIKWPDPNEAPSPARSFNLVKPVVLPSGKPTTYFPMSEQDLWGGRWKVSAHLIVEDPYWSASVTFNVDPSQTLGTPVSNMPSIKIISPKEKQSIAGNVAVKVQLDHFGPEEPVIELKWWWNPPSAPGAWPETPKSKEIVAQMSDNKIIVPHSAFDEEGSWRLLATVRLDEHRFMSDDVIFIINDSSTLAAGIKKTPPMTINTAKHPTLKPLTAPTIMNPAENQRIQRPGYVPVISRTSAPETELTWEVEYKPFNKPNYVRKNIRISNPSGSQIKTARLNFASEGYYRFRVKEKGAAGPWSAWRTIIVGNPVKIQPEQKGKIRAGKTNIRPTQVIKPVDKEKIQTLPITTPAESKAGKPQRSNNQPVRPTLQQ